MEGKDRMGGGGLYFAGSLMVLSVNDLIRSP